MDFLPANLVIITPALTIGAFAERMKSSAVLLSTALWVTIVYFPVSHMAWDGERSCFDDMGVFDFSDSDFFHIMTGFSSIAGSVGLCLSLS